MPNEPDDLARAVAKLQGRSPSDQRLILVGLINQRMPRGKRAVLVGGALVQVYTAGAYVSGDLDLVGEREAVVRILEPVGFRHEGRYLVHPELNLVLEVPGDRLRPTEQVVDLEFEGYKIPAVRVEDLIVDRLLAAKYWRSPTDLEQAILLYRAHRARLDQGELRRAARQNEVEDTLDQVAGAAAGSRT